MDKNYLLYCFKSNKTALAIAFLMAFLLFPFLVFITNNGAYMFPHGWLSGLTVLTSFILPLYILHYTVSKKENDVTKSLPIDDVTLLNTKIVFALISIFIVFTINYFLGHLVGSLLGYPIRVDFMLYVWFLVMLFSSLAFIINSAIMLQCSHVVDAALCQIGYAVLPMLSIVSIDNFLRGHSLYAFMHFSLTEKPITRLFSPILFGFAAIVEMTTNAVKETFNETYVKMALQTNFKVQIPLFVLIGIVAYIICLKSVKVIKNEDVETSSTKFVTFPLLIAWATTIIAVFTTAPTNDIKAVLLAITILFVLYNIANWIALRKVVIKKMMIIQFIAIIVVVHGFNGIYMNYIGRYFDKKFINTFSSVRIDFYDSYKYNGYSYYGMESFTDNDVVIKETRQVMVKNTEQFYNAPLFSTTQYDPKDVYMSILFNDDNNTYSRLKFSSYEDALKYIDMLKKENIEMTIESEDTEYKK